MDFYFFFFGLLCLDLAQFHKHMTKIPVQPLQKKCFPLRVREMGEKTVLLMCVAVWLCLAFKDKKLNKVMKTFLVDLVDSVNPSMHPYPDPKGVFLSS